MRFHAHSHRRRPGAKPVPNTPPGAPKPPPEPPNHLGIDWLKKELRAITTPGGAIKNQYPELKKAYASYKMAVNRLLKRAEKQGEAQLARHIRRHLKTGLRFTWNDP
jgi:hypothetical protein